jgi:hypothetical protein
MLFISASTVSRNYRFPAFTAVNNGPDTAFLTSIFPHGSFEKNNLKRDIYVGTVLHTSATSGSKPYLCVTFS